MLLPFRRHAFGRRKKSAPCTNGSTLSHVRYVMYGMSFNSDGGYPPILFSTMQHFRKHFRKTMRLMMGMHCPCSCSAFFFSCLVLVFSLGAVRTTISFSHQHPFPHQHPRPSPYSTRQDKATTKARQGNTRHARTTTKFRTRLHHNLEDSPIPKCAPTLPSLSLSSLPPLRRSMSHIVYLPVFIRSSYLSSLIPRRHEKRREGKTREVKTRRIRRDKKKKARENKRREEEKTK